MIIYNVLLISSTNIEELYAYILRFTVPVARDARISQWLRLISSEHVDSPHDVGSSPVDQLVISHGRRSGVS